MPSTTTETLLLEALERLRNGEPKHQDLVNVKYKLSPTNLAKESGISRNTIYTRYRPILEQLRKARVTHQSVTQPPLTISDKIAELRSIKYQLETDNQYLATHNADLLARAQRAEDERDAALRRVAALQPKHIRN